MTKDVCGIYCIFNIQNGRKYIGQSINCYERMTEHKRQLRKNIHENEYLQRSWNKYEKEKFFFAVLQECSRCELDELEKYYIKLLKSEAWNFGYNITKGGNKPPSPKGKPKSESWYINQRKAKLGKKFSEERRNNIAKSQIGRRYSDQTKENKRMAMAGVKKAKHSSSKYVGVSWDKRWKKWNANITKGKGYYLGSFRKELDAARAYDKKCWELYHDVSKLNFPENYSNGVSNHAS